MRTKAELIDRSILIIRGQRVMLDTDLAEIYGVETKRLNEQVKRNRNRFPEDFMFQINDQERVRVVANCDHLERIKFRKTNPYAFTEHGAIMLASVLNTPIAIQTSVLIVRAFVRLRHLIQSNRDIEQKILEMENKYDKQFQAVFDALRRLIRPENPKLDNRKRIGYKLSKGDE